MTEDEAKTKWCPAFRGNDHGINRPFEIDAAPPGFCLGSACMAWRWFGTHVNDPNGGTDLVFSNTTHGTCGLAGPWFAEMHRREEPR